MFEICAERELIVGNRKKIREYTWVTEISRDKSLTAYVLVNNLLKKLLDKNVPRTAVGSLSDHCLLTVELRI